MGNRYRVRLTKVSNGEALRTNEVEGITDELPRRGKSFVLVGKSLTPGAVARLVETSPVVEFDHTTVMRKNEAGKTERTDTFTIKTENSTYRVDLLGVEQIDGQ